MPEDFTFPDNNDKPIRSGDYLDELLTPSANAKSNPPKPSAASLNRTRINIRKDGRQRLSNLQEHMAKFGPEPDIRLSEIIESLILALYESRQHLDMSNVRRRGKFGSTSHKNFPVTLAESVSRAIAKNEADKSP